MKSLYTLFFSHRRLPILWLMTLALPLKAQLTTAPVIQGQAVIDGGFINNQSQARLARASTGEFGILNGIALTYLTAAGTFRSAGAIEGSVQTSTSPVEYTRPTSTAGLAPTPDGGFVVLASDATNTYIIKKAANHDRVWSTIIRPRSNQSGSELYGGFDILPSGDGGYLIFAVLNTTGNAPNTNVTKADGNGTILWSRNLFPDEPASIFGTSSIGYQQVAASPDGTYLLTGAEFRPLARPQPYIARASKIDAEARIIWTRLYGSTSGGGLVGIEDQTANPNEPGTYLMLGRTDPDLRGSGGPVHPFLVQTDGSLVQLGSVTVSNQARLAADGSGQPHYVILDQSSQNGGDFLLRGFNAANQSVWSRTLGGSGADAPQAILTTGDGYLLGGTTTSTDGDLTGRAFSGLATWAVKLTKTPGSLVLNKPVYNCLTGLLTFSTTGGDNTPIIYSVPGVRRNASTDNFGTVEPGLRGDPKPIPISATQSGQTTTIIFDFAATCSSFPLPPPPPLPPGFALQPPTYNCQTGAITFNISGSNGAPITYSAPGIMRSSPTSNVGTVEPGLRADPKLIPITATQSGQTSMFMFDLPTLCGRQARTASPENQTGLQLVVLGNPTTTAVSVAVSGAEGQAVRLELLDSRGSVLGQRAIGQAGEREIHTFELGQQAGGVFLVRATSGVQSQTAKVVKQ